MSALTIDTPIYPGRGQVWRAPRRSSASDFTLAAPEVRPTTASTFEADRAPEQRWSREELLKGIILRLNRDLARASILPPKHLLATFLGALSSLVFDGAPTPQLAVSDSGAIEVEWLVNGNSLTLAVDAEGDAALWACSPDGIERFGGSPDRESGKFDKQLLDRAAAYLSALAPSVRERAWEASAP